MHDRPGARRRHRLHLVEELASSPARTTSPTRATKADQAHQVRLLAAELGEHGIRVNGINPDGVVRGSGIFAGGWGAKRAAVYGVPEEELGAVLRPAHPAQARGAARARRQRGRSRCTGGDLTHTTGPAHPGRRRRRRRLPAMSAAVDSRRVRAPSTSARPAAGSWSAVVERRPARADARCTGSRTGRCGVGGTLHWDIARPVRGRARRAARGCARGRRPARRRSASTRWAVDYGLLDADGALLGNPVHYRDARTRRRVDAVHAAVAADELYRRQRAAVPAVQHALPARGRRAAPRSSRPRRPAAADPRPARATG